MEYPMEPADGRHHLPVIANKNNMKNLSWSYKSDNTMVIPHNEFDTFLVQLRLQFLAIHQLKSSIYKLSQSTS